MTSSETHEYGHEQADGSAAGAAKRNWGLDAEEPPPPPDDVDFDGEEPEEEVTTEEGEDNDFPGPKS